VPLRIRNKNYIRKKLVVPMPKVAKNGKSASTIQRIDKILYWGKIHRDIIALGTLIKDAEEGKKPVATSDKFSLLNRLDEAA
jgi:hypothetical protein